MICAFASITSNCNAAATQGTNAKIVVSTAKLSSFQSKRYQVKTNANLIEARKIANHMDRIFDEYSHRFNALSAKTKQPMPLYLFAKRAEYVQFLKSHGINGNSTGGIFFIRKNVRGLATWIHDRPRWITLETLQHEGFHQFAHIYIGTKLPLWVNEGLAEYFGDAILANDRLHIGITNGRRIQTIQRAFKENKQLSANELMSMPSGKWQLNLMRNPTKGRLQYDQSWAMVHFLIHGENGKFRTAFEQYLVLVAKGTDSSAAFKHAFGADDTVAFERRWSTWARKLKPDPVDTAVRRMRFIGQGLLLLTEKREKTPANIGDLQRRLVKIGFRAIRIENGVQTEVKANDATLYVYEHPRGGIGSFHLQAPTESGMPPRITAPGLTPQPTLGWDIDKDGKLVAAVDYH